MKEVDVQGHKFTYEEMGEGKEDLVFIHGWSSSRFFWKPVLSEFMEFGKITNLDLVGHYPGSSPKSFRNFGADKVIEIQAEALRKIFPEKKLTLIGHSTGGYVVLGIAARYPELVNRVIVICPVVHGPVEGLLALMKLSYEWNLSPVVSFALQSFMMSPNSMEILMNGSVYDWDDFIKQKGMKEFISEYAEYFKKLDFDLMGAFLVSLDKCDLNPILHQIKAKTLFIAGKEDLIVGSHNSIEASARVKGSELLILNHSGHMPIYEEKEATIGKMKSWLKS